MTIIYFFYGLSFFAMGLAAILESRHASRLPLGHHLHWLGFFGLLHGGVEWVEMLRQLDPASPLMPLMDALHAILLPVSVLLLVRFGIGLVTEAGPLPEWMAFAPILLFTPVTLLVAYGIIMAVTAHQIDTASDVWSRYLIYLPGNLLAAFGFVRQWRSVQGAHMKRARCFLLGAAGAFLVNAAAAGLIVPPSPYGLAPWLNYDSILAATGIPVQVWRTLAAVGIMFFVGGALDVFEAERQNQLQRLEAARIEAQHETLATSIKARAHAEAWLNGLVSLSRRIANMEKVDQILFEIGALARRLLHADTATLALLDSTANVLTIHSVTTEDGLQRGQGQPVSHPVLRHAVELCRPLRYPEDLPASQTPWICPLLKRRIGALAVVPLQLEAQPLGGLWVGRYAETPFTGEDVTGLTRLADHAVIALEHASLTSRLQSLAIVEERARIAREMHDGLAQLLGFLSLEMQTLTALIRHGESQEALDELSAALASIKAAQADVRENILSLRTTLSGKGDLIVSLRQYIDEFGVQTGLRAQFTTDVATSPTLPPAAEAQVVRIFQEALTNVRKHARAANVEVCLDVRDGLMCFSVADDGVGMQQEAIVGSHFGLLTMRERAASIDGELNIYSAPGEGTRVELRLPLGA